jgi:hypothetical protein
MPALDGHGFPNQSKEIEGALSVSVLLMSLDSTIRIRALAEVLAGEGMDRAHVGHHAGKGIPGDVVVAAGPLDRDQHVAQVVRPARFLELGHGGLKFDAVVGHRGGWHEDIAVKITEHPLKAGLGAIDPDNAEMFGADLLDPRMNEAARLLEDRREPGTGAFAGTCCWHDSHLREKGQESIPSILVGSW